MLHHNVSHWQDGGQQFALTPFHDCSCKAGAVPSINVYHCATCKGRHVKEKRLRSVLEVRQGIYALQEHPLFAANKATVLRESE